MTRLIAGALAVLAAAAPAVAQQTVRKQREAAEAALKMAGVQKANGVETDGALVYSSGPADGAKDLAANLQKVMQTSRSALGVGADDALWTGKLTVVVLSDPQQYAAYFKSVTGRDPKEGELTATNLKGSSPVMLVGPAPAGSGIDPAQAAAALMANAVLTRRAGLGEGNGRLPDWLTTGFAKSMLNKSSDDPVAQKAYRNGLRESVLGAPGQPDKFVTIENALTGPRTPENVTMSAAFVEYLMARNDSGKFTAFLTAFREEPGRPVPTTTDALATLPLLRVSMETDWKVWAAQQR